MQPTPTIVLLLIPTRARPKTSKSLLHTDPNEITDKFLQRERAAVETYRQVLYKARQEPARNAELRKLATILSAHLQAAAQLEARIQQPEPRAARGIGGWGTWSKVVMGAANIFADRMVLRALKAGEESGFKRYQEVLEATAELKLLFLDLLAKQQTHLRTLDRLISKDSYRSVNAETCPFIPQCSSYSRRRL